MFFHRFNESIHSHLGYSGKQTLSVSLLFPKDMFVLYEWLMLPMTITCRPSRSFFLFLFVSFFMFAKTIHPSLSMRKAFSLYTYIPIHEKLFPYTHALKKTLSLYINMVYSSCGPDFDIWGKTNSCVKVSVSGWISILFPRGTRNNDDLETTCKISHGHN